CITNAQAYRLKESQYTLQYTIIYQLSGIRHKAGGCFFYADMRGFRGRYCRYGDPHIEIGYLAFFRLPFNQAGGLYLFGRYDHYDHAFRPNGR
ncbi:hypothetical protein ACNB5P_005137, partial [Escherichia coli]